MSVIILIIILGILIFVHELGHFIIAKKSGIRVDEFAIGFPPKLWSWTKGGTKYALNLIPFGGYVKIFGESADEESLDPNRPDSLLNKSRWTQASVLVGGVLFNIIFAYILFVIVLMAGFPTTVTDSNRHNIVNSNVVVTNIFPGSPAEISGIEAGDKILEISTSDQVLQSKDITISSIQNIISTGKGDVTVNLQRNGENRDVVLIPVQGIIGDKPAIGISMDRIGQLQLPFFSAIGSAYFMTGQMMRDITLGLTGLIGQAISGNGSLDNVAGPVGIVGLVDSATNFGITYLLGFTAFISINLAILNILPLPALDGGRLVIVLIEGVTKRQIKPELVNNINAIGFLLLILLMIVITINDVLRLF
jgi:regulator of sigma E protease